MESFTLAPGLEVTWVSVADLREQDLNAQVMQPREFERLTENIRERGALESLPYCTQQDDGPVEIVSGHHRVRASRAAGLEKIPVILDRQPMTRSTITAKQIAHNALVGSSNEEVLRRMVAQIADVDDLLSTGLPDDFLPIPRMDNPVMSTPQASFDWRTVSLAFLPHQLESLREVVEHLDGADLVGVAPVELFDDFARYLAQFARFRDIRSVGTTVAVLTRIALDRIAMDTSDEERWVSYDSVFDGNAMPAEAGRVVREALARAGFEHPWQALEKWAAEELAS